MLNTLGPNLWTAVSAVATSAAALGTLGYLVYSVKLWRATAENTRATRESIALTHQIFEATHRPFVAVEIEFSVKGRSIEISCNAKNTGADQASATKLTLTSADGLYVQGFLFGDLQPQESRTVVFGVHCTEALVKNWLRQSTETWQPLYFSYRRTFKTAQREWCELGEFYCDLSSEVLELLGRMARGAVPMSAAR